jgi:hypothetical protein
LPPFPLCLCCAQGHPTPLSSPLQPTSFCPSVSSLLLPRSFCARNLHLPPFLLPFLPQLGVSAAIFGPSLLSLHILVFKIFQLVPRKLQARSRIPKACLGHPALHAGAAPTVHQLGTNPPQPLPLARLSGECRSSFSPGCRPCPDHYRRCRDDCNHERARRCFRWRLAFWRALLHGPGWSLHLFLWQKRPISVAKEAYFCGKRGRLVPPSLSRALSLPPHTSSVLSMRLHTHWRCAHWTFLTIRQGTLSSAWSHRPSSPSLSRCCFLL